MGIDPYTKIEGAARVRWPCRGELEARLILLKMERSLLRVGKRKRKSRPLRLSIGVTNVSRRAELAYRSRSIVMKVQMNYTANL